MDKINFDTAALLVQGGNWFINGLFMSIAWTIGSASARAVGGLFRRGEKGDRRYGR